MVTPIVFARCASACAAAICSDRSHAHYTTHIVEARRELREMTGVKAT
jgi:hypothetical protein